MKKLYLNDNQLKGDIPIQIGNLNNLEYLHLENNKLNGNIPIQLGNLIKLIQLWLNSNLLNGSIPSEFAKLRNLKKLYLDNNFLSGSIPTQLGNLTNLQRLYLHKNLLLGEIPVTLKELTKLRINLFDLSYNCLYANDSELRVWLDSIDLDWESFQSECSSRPPLIYINRFNLNFTYIIGSNVYPVDSFRIDNNGGGTLTWSVSNDVHNVSLSPISGTNSGIVEVRIDPIALIPGNFHGEIYVSAPSASNSPLKIDINLVVKFESQSSPPVGEFATPINNTTVSGSIPVTGWTLGDTGIDNVKICREEGSDLVYIGDAVFVEGARPDIETLFPNYPMNYKAGWGFMMLTNFLPNSGNGTFKIHAIATDREGKMSTIGVKTIIVDNANAVNPFGAIDTPTQGGTASGGSFTNWGWALTPQPNSIPTNGSTIDVWVDGVNFGHPIYNIYRSDIAGLFPTYVNSNGAVGYLYLDIRKLQNGLHTIQWTVTDDAGNADGIGSRYFSVLNSGQSSSAEVLNNKFSVFDTETPDLFPNFDPVRFKKGFNDDIATEEIFPDDEGVIQIDIKELERIEVNLNNLFEDSEYGSYSKPENAPSGHTTGYLMVCDQLRSLPIGSTLDNEKGVFYWLPGPGFIGDYDFLFIRSVENYKEKIRVKIAIAPK